MGLGAVLSLITIPIVIGLGIYNIRSLIRKVKNNLESKGDLIMGVVIWSLAICGLIYIFIQQLPK